MNGAMKDLVSAEPEESMIVVRRLTRRSAMGACAAPCSVVETTPTPTAGRDELTRAAAMEPVLELGLETAGDLLCGRDADEPILYRSAQYEIIGDCMEGHHGMGGGVWDGGVLCVAVVRSLHNQNGEQSDGNTGW